MPGSNTQPYRYQMEGVRILEKKFHLRGLLADEMGLGKSLQALMTIHRNPEIQRVLIICPASLKYHWEKEAKVHFNYPSEILEGTTPRRIGRHRPPRITIINYDILYAWMDYLYWLNPDMVVVDECHMIGSMDTRRTKKVMEICHKRKRILCLSGTPLVNRPKELYPTLRILLPWKFRNFARYARRYCQPRRAPWGWTFNGATRLKELHRILNRQCMVRRLKKDVLKELPKKSIQVEPMDISHRKQYREAERDFIPFLMRNDPTKVQGALKAQILFQFNYLKRLAGLYKLPSTFEWIDQFLEECDDKLLVFAIHKPVVGGLFERYRSLAVKVDGSLTGRKRQGAFDHFKQSKKCRLLIGNIVAAGVGWNAVPCHDVAFAELAWNPGTHGQCIDRCHRIGQKLPVKAYFLVGKDTIEEDICELQQKKQKILDTVLDGKEGVSQMDIYNELIRMYRRKGGRLRV